jgi:hypothetical protein
VKFAAMLGAAGACAAMTLAGSAAADEEPAGIPEGVYTFAQDGGGTDEWEITPLCVPTVTDGRIPVADRLGCKLQVGTSGPGSGAYRLTGDKWTFVTDSADGTSCPDGSTAPSVDTYAFDDALNGTYSSAHNRVCGLAPGIDRRPFTLTFIKPLPNPVIRYPLHCQDNMQHLCS